MANYRILKGSRKNKFVFAGVRLMAGEIVQLDEPPRDGKGNLLFGPIVFRCIRRDKNQNNIGCNHEWEVPASAWVPETDKNGNIIPINRFRQGCPKCHMANIIPVKTPAFEPLDGFIGEAKSISGEQTANLDFEALAAKDPRNVPQILSDIKNNYGLELPKTTKKVEALAHEHTWKMLKGKDVLSGAVDHSQEMTGLQAQDIVR